MTPSSNAPSQVDSSDETEGRRLYRAQADALAQSQISMATRKVKIRKDRKAQRGSQVEVVLSALRTIDASGSSRRPVWLRHEGEHVVVLVQTNGEWIEVIRERSDGAFSHIWEDNS
jgi:hypothetical protein